LLDQLHSICTPSPEDTLQIFSLFSTKNGRRKKTGVSKFS
jgi:hypothetical protein